MRETVQRLGVNSKRSQSVVGWEKKPRMFELETGRLGGGGWRGAVEGLITVFLSEGLSRGGRRDLLCVAPQYRTRAHRGGGKGCKKAGFAQYRNKFVTIGAAQPAWEAMSCSSQTCGSKSSRKGLDGCMRNTCMDTSIIITIMPASVYCALTMCQAQC